MTNLGIRRRLKLKKNVMQTIRPSKGSCMFGHICRKNDNRLIKTTDIFGMMNETSQRGRPARDGWMTSDNGVNRTYIH